MCDMQERKNELHFCTSDIYNFIKVNTLINKTEMTAQELI